MGIIIEIKNHYEVLCILNYVNITYNTRYTQHDFGGGRIKFIYIAPNGNVSYIKTFKSAAKLGKVIHTFHMFVSKVISENNRLRLQIDNLHKELQDSYNKLAEAEAEAASRFKTIFKL